MLGRKMCHLSLSLPSPLQLAGIYKAVVLKMTSVENGIHTTVCNYPGAQIHLYTKQVFAEYLIN